MRLRPTERRYLDGVSLVLVSVLSWGWGDRAFAAPPSSLQELDSRLTQLRAEIDALPIFEVAPLPKEHLGYRMHPYLLKDGYQSYWVQIDLGESVRPDLVAVLPTFNSEGRAFDFPPCFEITLSDDPEGEGGRVLLDHSQAPFPAGRHAFLLISNLSGASGRYLRLRVLGGIGSGGGWAIPTEGSMFQISEIFVFRGESNLALGAPVTSSMRDVPNDSYRASGLTDGWFPLGLPEDPRISSLCEGYHSFHSGGGALPSDPYWVQVDLGAVCPIDQVNLLPTNPKNFSQEAGYGFPRRFRIEASPDAGFGDPHAVFDSGDHGFPEPTTHHLSFPAAGVRARYVRLTVPELVSGSWDTFFFTLAELQVISDGKNVSRGRPVQAYQSLDELYYPGVEAKLSASADPEFRQQWRRWGEARRKLEVEKVFERDVLRGGLPWGKPILVDGFSSRHRLMAMPEWLTKLHRRGELELEAGRLSRIRESMVREELRYAEARLYFGLSVAALVSLGCLAWLWNRGKRKNMLLKTRIAQDLHDDLSSDLCNMALVSQLLESGGARGDEATLKRIRTLKDTARRSVDSLRDIIFLTDEGTRTWADLVARLRDIPHNLLEPLEIAFHFSCDERSPPPKKVSPEFLRHLILIYKEALSNVAKHSRADVVLIGVTTVRRRISIRIEDNGCGMDGAGAGGGGIGLRSMRMRAEAIGGDVQIGPGNADGIRLEINVPI